ncbi:hypothetical protein [Puia dinghuensis]|uniref:DUF4168 domain-containing protein n=1 Tax=Puia dinghuensis TaxID=1792502 RepID=A0A8J2XVC5_9BACT|nr:hypothetical protein [Puia dinghuensis]GGB17451.1 hypothetical protein GCM10011511_46550 [Puia dinghuensis]
MKISNLFLACITTIAVYTAEAQTPPPGNPSTQTTQVVQPPKAPPTQRAVHQLEALQERIDLSQDQVISLNSVLLAENIALDSLQEHPSGDQKLDGKARYDIFHEADVRIYSFLNDSQQYQYVIWKQEQRMKNLEKRNQTMQAALDSLSRQQPQNH